MYYIQQSMGQCHTVSIDKTDGCQVYLSKECLDVEIITAKSSEMNVLVPNKEGEFVSRIGNCNRLIWRELPWSTSWWIGFHFSLCCDNCWHSIAN